MPSTMIHLYVAKSACEKYSIINKSEFYLGSIASDTVNLNGFASREDRYSAHFRDDNESVWIKNLDNFFENEKSDDEKKNDFLRGLMLHNIVDIAWDEYCQEDIFKYLNQVSPNLPGEKFWELRWNYIYSFDTNALKSDWWTKDVRTSLLKAKPYSFSNVSENELLAYKELICSGNPFFVKNLKPFSKLDDKYIDITVKASLERIKKYL